MICLEPLGHGVLLNMPNILESMFLVELRRLSRSTGLRVLEERRRSAPSGAEVGNEAPSGAEVGSEAPFGAEVGLPSPFGTEVGIPPPFGEWNLAVVVGDRKVDSGPFPVEEGR